VGPTITLKNDEPKATAGARSSDPHPMSVPFPLSPATYYFQILTFKFLLSSRFAADEVSAGSNASAFVPQIPLNVLQGHVDDIERLSCDYTDAATISSAQDTIAQLVGHWPTDIPFSVQNFGSAPQLLLFVKAIFERESACLKPGQSLDEATTLRSLKLRLLDALRGHDSNAHELCNLITNFSLRLLSACIGGEGAKLKPTRAVVKTLECKHPYDDNMDQTWPISIPGAKWMKIVFDARSSTEKNCDYVDIFKTAAKDEKWGTRYTGRASGGEKTWAGVGSVPYCRVEADNCHVAFHSGINNISPLPLEVTFCIAHR